MCLWGETTKCAPHFFCGKLISLTLLSHPNLRTCITCSVIFLRSQKPQVHDCTHTILSRNHSIHSLDVGTSTYICDFHREQCWARWLRKADNGLTEHRERGLQLLHCISKSPTEDSYHDNVATLKTSKVWQSSPLPEAKV